ncbi:hypothetical protein O181_104334 [Austropuccinia psidii MF-1]|uniref:Uncharacterized protein n=1 Tax=Austropuccinia psidii MF-1 TaxID=1389203 RepID=A0A9Q3PK23_9BASI|nr:hypothetical protein [Austropuccinia psidii MF-1]
MVSSYELGIEVESLEHESNADPPVLPESFISAQPPSSQKPDFKSYEKEKTVEPCAPTEDTGQDEAIFSGEVEIISKEQFVSNISQTIPRLEKIENDSVEVGESLPEGSKVVIGVPGKGLGKSPNINDTKKTNKKWHTFEATTDSQDQGDDMIDVEVDHIDNEPPHTKSPPILNEKIHDEAPPASPQNIQAFQERETIKHDTMGPDRTDIMPDPEPKVSSSPNIQGIFLSCIEEFEEILNYHSNITQESWKRGLDYINSIYKN